MKFKIKKIRKFMHKFDVVVEHEAGNIEVFPFNNVDGWDQVVNEEEKWLTHIKQTIQKRKEEKSKIDVDSMIKKHEGQEYAT